MARHALPTLSRRALRAQAARERAAASAIDILAHGGHTLAALLAARTSQDAEAANANPASVPALKDAQATLGAGDRLADTDQAWVEKHATAGLRTVRHFPEEFTLQLRAIPLHQAPLGGES